MAKPHPQPDNPAQSKRFIELATELEAGGTAEDFDQVFQTVLTAKKGPPPQPQQKRPRRRKR